MEGYNLTTMLKRLEAATSRLEDIVVFADGRSQPAAAKPTATATAPPAGGASAPAPAAPAAISPAAGNGQPPAPAAAAAAGRTGRTGAAKLRELSQLLDAWVELSTGIDAGVEEQAKAFRSAAEESVKLVELASTRAKPEMAEFAAILGPLNEQVSQTDKLRDVHRKNVKYANFFATVPSGAPALGWISIEGKDQAANFIAEMRDSAKFYGNRVLKDGKENKPWVDAYISYLESLRSVVKSEFPEGLVWSAASAAPAAPSAPSAPAAAGGPPPPPPPPPSVEQLTASLNPAPAAPAASSGGGMSGVFDELSRGESIASGLKPVDRKALKSQKPPISKATKPRPGSASAASSAPSAGSRPVKLNPRVELVESRWYVEDLVDRHDVEIQATMGQSVQIDNVSNCTIKILGKAATFSLSRSKKVGLLVETMVASTDVVNCSDFGIQVTGSLPSLMIDQSQHGSIYLSEDSLGVDIFTSQTTAINVNIPESEPGAFREVPLGEQIVHNIVGGKVKSSVVNHA